MEAVKEYRRAIERIWVDVNVRNSIHDTGRYIMWGFNKRICLPYISFSKEKKGN